MSLRMAVYESIEEVPARAWDAAVEASGAPIFYTRNYLSAYEASKLHGAEGHLYMVASRLGGEEEAHAVLPLVFPAEVDPLGVVSEAFPALELGARCLLAPGWHCYDGFVPMTRQDGRLLGALIEALERVARERSIAWLALVNVEEGSEQCPVLEGAGFSGRRVDERFAMDLRSFACFEAYVKTLSANLRRETRRYARRALASGLESIWSRPADADLDGVLGLVQLTAARYSNAAFYPAGPFQEFVRLLGDSGLVVELRIGGKLVGAAVCMIAQGRFHQWAGGVDYDAVEGFSPYGVLFEQTVRAALESGATTFEAGRGNGSYKTRRGLRARQLHTFVRALA